MFLSEIIFVLSPKILFLGVEKLKLKLKPKSKNLQPSEKIIFIYFFSALKRNRPNFVKLLIENYFDMNHFMTVKRLYFLYHFKPTQVKVFKLLNL